MTDEREKLAWWVRDAANSICGQTGAVTHQEKLLEAAAYIEAHPAPAPVEYDEVGLWEMYANAVVERGGEKAADEEKSFPHIRAAMDCLRTLAGRLSQVTAQRDELVGICEALDEHAPLQTISGVCSCCGSKRQHEVWCPVGRARAALSRIKGEQI